MATNKIKAVSSIAHLAVGDVHICVPASKWRGKCFAAEPVSADDTVACFEHSISSTKGIVGARKKLIEFGDLDSIFKVASIQSLSNL